MKNLLNTQRGVKLINKFSTIKVLVVGDVMIDQFIWGRVKRISPEAPVPVVSVTSESFRLGGAANVVSNIYSLGGKPHICGVIGNDDMGKKILEMLDVLGIEIDDEIVVEPNRITTVKTRIIAHNQQVVRIDREVVKTIDESTREFLVTYILGHINELDGLIISDYEKGVISESILPEILTRAKESGRIVTVDPRSNNFDAYKFVTAITPNHIEAGHSVGFEIVDEASLSRAGKILLNKLECNCVL
ncbi:MAG: PfkB family carbohydrate kinase, partial [Thermodesulfobacteriota bacterium]|nr:PfkB family carbohydrate kinase [Thermodesulfobacteriota bacterium]